MQDRPDLSDDELLTALRRFGITNATASYVPVGFGDHHWAVADADGNRWFTSVADLRHKDFTALRQAMDTALALAQRLPFVVAPLTAGASTVVELGDRFALSVFPHVDGDAGEFGHPVSDPDDVIDLVAALHGAPPPAGTPVAPVDVPARPALTEERPWHGGPYAGAARELLAEHSGLIAARLAEFDELAERISGARQVVTHGEPHPGNLIRTDTGYRLIDWDTAGLAVPERDLAVLPGDCDLTRYSALTGHVPDAAALRLYRLRWILEDLAWFVELFRGPHERTPDVESSWRYFTGTLRALTS